VGICRYCGQRAGWFSDVHDACAASCKQGCEQVVAAVSSAVKDRLKIPTEHPDTPDWYSDFALKMWAELKQTVDNLTAEHKIPSDDAHRALMRGWSISAQELAFAEPLNPDTWSVMSRLYGLMGFTDGEMRKTEGFLAASFSMLLWSVMVHGDPTPFASVQPHPFNLHGGEIPLMFFGSVVYSKETVSRSYQGGYGGMSVRLARGMYYHFGGFRGQRIDASTLKEIDYGGLLITTQNLYFGGDHTNFRIPYDHVVSFRAHSDGIGIFRDSASAKAEVFTVLEADPGGGNPVSARPVFGWFLYNIAHFLAQPEARTLYAKAKA